MEKERKTEVGFVESYASESFAINGPVHLTSVDWRSANDRKSIAASLVNGVYVLESDRRNNRVGPKAMSPPWWNFFQFQLIESLLDKDSTYFGAIFEYKGTQYQHNSIYNPPRFVLAFRGTVKNSATLTRDLKLDARLALNRSLARDLRYKTAIDALHRLVSFAGPSSVWMAGHSLGAAIALQVGKSMAKSRYYIESYLFNPPFSSAPIEILENEILRSAIRVARDVITAKLCQVLPQQYSAELESFLALRPWIPYLFVHPKDVISSEYIGYFGQRLFMESIGLGRAGNIATRSAGIGLVLGALGRDSEATHLIPSAFVTRNMRSDMTNIQAHGIQQWWQKNCVCYSQLHQIN